jgi:hypothetical protein
MKKENSVWVQIKEEQKDYQYFKRYDNKNLKVTLETCKNQGYIETQS